MEGGFFVPIKRHTEHSGHHYMFWGSLGAQSHSEVEERSEAILGELRKEFYSKGDAPVKSTVW